jgi:protein-S-isoprenylcysteine O-methyltransferase Ste14
MPRFLLPLLAGFLFAGASAFTAAWSRRWGEGGGRLASAVLRNLLGIPLYFFGLVLAWRSPAPLLADPGGVGVGLGWLLIGAGAIPVALGHWQLGRLTHLPSQGDALMERGLYARVRHPIYAGGLAIFAGLALLRPTAPWLLACALAALFMLVQARLEEIDLMQRMPGYRAYRERVPAWLPRVPGLGPWVWLCPAVGILLAAGVLRIFGLSWWSALLAALMLVCPAILAWGVGQLCEPPHRNPGR